MAQTDALGNQTSYTYDANGNQLTETRTRGLESIVTSYEYDGSGRRTKVTYPDGTTTRTVYNSLGKPASTFDQLGAHFAANAARSDSIPNLHSGAHPEFETERCADAN